MSEYAPEKPQVLDRIDTARGVPRNWWQYEVSANGKVVTNVLQAVAGRPGRVRYYPAEVFRPNQRGQQVKETFPEREETYIQVEIRLKADCREE